MFESICEPFRWRSIPAQPSPTSQLREAYFFEEKATNRPDT